MKKNIINLNFSQLKKIEVQTLANRVLAIVEKHNPEALKIDQIFDILVEQKPQIKLLKVGYGPHPITKDLKALRKRRNAFMQGLINRLNTIENTKMSGMEEALKVAKPDVLRYMQGLSRESEETITGTVIQFFDFIQENTKFATALETLDLSSDLNGLKIVSSEIEQQYDNRTEDLSIRPKMNTRKIVSELKSDIQYIFKEIELQQIKNRNLDYNLLIDELNKEIAHYKAIIRTRASINKKKAEGEIDNNEIVVEDISRKTHESTETTQGVNPLSVEVVNENPGLIDIEKTAAMPGKQTRLPIVSTEG